MNMRTCLVWFIAGFLLWTLCPVLALASDGERILDFSSDITVLPNSSMQVTETIKVNALGDVIKHGIYRDFPTSYKDVAGNRYMVGFKVLEVQRDGVSESFHVESAINGVRVYIGKSDELLQPDQYTYTLRYATDNQLGFFSDHDELYWNVTGNGWGFPIEKVTATVHLPDGVDWSRVSSDGYTGVSGATNKDFQASVVGKEIMFSTVKPLLPQEGMTIVVGWPKGLVKEPSAQEKALRFLSANSPTILLMFGCVIITLYYLWIWWRFGCDPRPGTVIPLYEPPRGLSPSAMRYVQRFGFDNKTLTAAIINMAVKGCIKIKEEDKRYTLEKIGEPVQLSSEEKEMFLKLFSSGDTLVLENDNYREIQSAIAAAKKQLGGEYKGKYFVNNTLYFLIGVASSLVVLGVAMALVVNYSSIMAVPWLMVASIVVLTAINIAFYSLLKASTVAGRLVLDEIQGFRWFLSVTEKDRLNFHNPPGITPELFERFLPYAVALNVEQQWAKQFADVLQRAGEDPGHYTPQWYYGSMVGINGLANLTSHVGSSLNVAISSASRPPGSSSGFGGGSSGGGGGGGGGGGW